MPGTITFDNIGASNPSYTLDDNTVFTSGGVRSDSANPTSPVLAGSTFSFNLPISVSFEIPVASVSLDAGFFDNLNSTRILFLGPNGEILNTQFNSTDDGIENFSFTAGDIPIAGISAVAVRQEDAGFAIDNLVVGEAVIIELPELQDGQGNAASLEFWLGSIDEAVNSVQTTTLGPGDMSDTFGFFAPTPVRVTFSVTAQSNPNTVVEYEIDYGTGTHFFNMTDIEGYTEAEEYSLAVVSVVDTSNATAAAAEQAGIDLAQNLLKLVAVDMKVLATQIAAVVSNADEAAAFYKGLSKGLGKAAIFLDVFFRVDNIYNADNVPRELFIQAVDFGTGLLAAWGGTAGGAAIGAWFAGVGAGIGGPLGGFGAGIIYSFGISSEVQEAAGDFWDANIAGDNKLAADIPETILTFDAELGEIVISSEIQMDTVITAEAFDPEFYLATYADAAEAVANGDVPSAYIHFLTVGAAAGYLPSAGATPVDPADLVGAGDPKLQLLASADSHWGIYQSPAIGAINGDGASAPEQAFYDAMVEERTEGVVFDFDAALTALANRRAIDLARNQGFDPVYLEAIGGEDWGSGDWANGQAFLAGARDMLTAISSFDLANSRVYAFTSDAATPAELIAELSSSLLGRQVLYDTDHRSVGIAEYGGVWVVITSTDFSDGPPAVEINDGIITRNGSRYSETMALGTWQGSLIGLGGRDNLFGGTEDDTISGGGSDDNLRGNGGNDLMLGNLGNDQMEGGDGNDFAAGGVGFDTLRGGNDDDSLTGADGYDELHGDDGNDVLLGNNGNDSLDGGAGNDSVVGGLGFDTMFGGDNDDSLTGGDGYDEIHGGAGNDELRGNNGFDMLFGDDGDDILLGGLSPDTMDGGAGNDTLLGQAGGDLISGGSGNDELQGNSGNDTLNGDDNRDDLRGGIGFDELNGGNGNDTLYGDQGFDVLNGGAGDDILQGNSGNDRMNGDAGNDVMRGGIGADVFMFTEGADVIIDHANGIDAIEISASLLSEGMPEVGDLAGYASIVSGNLVFDFGGGNSLTVNNVLSVNVLLEDTILI